MTIKSFNSSVVDSAASMVSCDGKLSASRVIVQIIGVMKIRIAKPHGQ